MFLPLPMPSVLELDVARLIALTDLTTRDGTRRLNAFENVMRMCAGEAMPAGWTLQPARHVRMHPATYEVLRAWVEEGSGATGSLALRLAAYASAPARDACAPAGWLLLRP